MCMYIYIYIYIYKPQLPAAARLGDAAAAAARQGPDLRRK